MVKGFISRTPLISVLMPVFNAERYIEGSIESILQQTFHNFELIIVDDCSTDKSWEIIQKYARNDKRVKILKNKQNLGLSRTLNGGIHIARGKYIARMDADDWSYPDRLEKQYKFMEEHSEIGISGGSREVYDKHMKKMISVYRYKLTDSEIRKDIFLRSPFCHPAIVCRADILKKAGGYSELLGKSEDYDFYFKMGLLCEFGNLPDVLIKYRRCNSSATFENCNRQDLTTLYVRTKAVFEYGYKMRAIDKVVFFIQLASIFIIPAKLRRELYGILFKLHALLSKFN